VIFFNLIWKFKEYVFAGMKFLDKKDFTKIMAIQKRLEWNAEKFFDSQLELLNAENFT